MVDVTVGYTVTCTIEYLDQNGNPMQVAQVPDAAPQVLTSIAISVVVQ